MVIGLALTFAGTLVSAAELDDATSAALDKALAAEIRSDAERARDRNRMPKQTLAFFGFAPDMRVVEIFPGGGWYTKILAPVLRDSGEYIAAGGLGKALGFGEILGGARDLAELKDIRVVDISGSLSTTEQRGVLNANALDFETTDADLVLTFRNLHNLTPAARAAIYKASYNALKDGGRFAAIDHTRRHMQGDNAEIWRRLDPVLVIKEAQSHGLKFVDYSRLHYRADDELRYEVGRRSVSGNTDRFTLLFEK